MRSLLSALAVTSLLAAPAVATAAAPTVKLVKAGDGAKAPLRYALKAGARDTMVMTMRMTMQISADGAKMPAVTMPDIIFDVGVKVASVDPKGVATCTFDFGKVRAAAGVKGIDEGMVKQLDTMLAKLAGLKGHASFTPRGEVLDSGVDATAVKDPALRQMIDSFESSFAQATTPLPAQPVGVGAVWTATQAIEANGIKLNQVATFELVSRKADRFEVKVTFDQTAKAQTMAMPGLPKGVDAKLLKAVGTGKGTSTIYPASLAPDSTLDLDMLVGVSIAMGGQTQAMDMKMATHVQVARKP